MPSVTFKTVLDQCRVTGGMSVELDFKRVTYLDGLEIAREAQPHSLALTPDADAEQWLDAVSANVQAARQWPAIDPAEKARALQYCAITHTDEVKAAYEAWKASQP